MSNYHEPVEDLSKGTKDFSRALVSLKEEIEAIDWYQQRIDASGNEELKAILEHNRDEEIEHACMTLEWLRRNMAGWDGQLRKYIYKEGDIIKREEKQAEFESNLEIGTLK
jgi:uncharacterized protein